LTQIFNKDGSISIYSTYRDDFGENVIVDNRIGYKRAVEIAIQLQICINALDKKTENEIRSKIKK
jgi:hypothetical protein